jgi:Raf kinase inhibitor-like YbhB/YbcL family protein
LVDDPRLLNDWVPPLAVRPPRVMFQSVMSLLLRPIRGQSARPGISRLTNINPFGTAPGQSVAREPIGKTTHAAELDNLFRRSAIPRRFTCDGEDLSPPLDWSGAPAGTRSFVLLCKDPDAPAGTWHHWAAYDIPAGQTALAAGGAGHAESQGFKQAINDFQRPGYGGPCPPRRHGPHHYHFRMLALSVDRLAIRQHPSCQGCRT